MALLQESNVNQQDRDEAELKKIAMSKTVIIDNLSLDLGLTAKETIKWIKERLVFLGERGDVQIMDINMNPFNQKVNNSSISLQVSDIFMVSRLKRLDNTMCLGKKLRVRKPNEETSQTNAQASAIAIQALLDLQHNKFRGAQDKPSESNGLDGVSLGTTMPSRIVKISNVHNREEPLSDDKFIQLYEDMHEELSSISKLQRLKVVRNGEERLGAEVGSIFAEFDDKKFGTAAISKLNGRVYDGRKVQICGVEESVYLSELYIK